MADLDDFFAKKDRKKAKGKKFVTTDDLAKRLEESGRKSEKSKDKKLSQSGDAGDERRPEQKVSFCPTSSQAVLMHKLARPY